ncbi:MAG: hypothetical protein LH477_14960 [Nocardioides sp.]|nr:hypothetical protein [Nocardioides sp.]
MSRVNAAWSLPDQTIERTKTADREIRISDFALIAVLPFRVVEVSGYPVNEFAMAALVGLCLFRPARGGAKLPALVMLLLAGLLALLVYSGAANEVDWSRRVGHVTVLAGLIWAGGTGRLSLRSVAVGLAAGLTAVIALALVRVGGDTYPGRLTGFLGDPNAGVYFIVVLGLLAIFFCDDRSKVRLVVALPMIAGLVLTYSRTGLLAGLFAVVWLLGGRRLAVVCGGGFAGGVVWVFNNIR